MITYLLQVSLCWIFFYSIYHLILRKETFFATNRWYLLLSLWGSLLIPPLGQWVKQLFTTSPADMGQVLYLLSETPVYISQSLEARSQVDWLSVAIYTLYFTGVAVVGTRLLYGLYKIWRLYRNGRKVRKQSYTLIYTNKEHLPFSFFNFVFFSEKVNLKPVFHQVIKHELSHVQQWHSVDVLLVEILQVFFWFNPILILYKKSLRETHEYFADACVLQGEDPKNYGRILLGQSASGLEIALANQFFNSQLKKRIRMMYQKKSNRSARFKYLMAVPLLFLALILFSNSMIVDEGPTPLKDQITKIVNESNSIRELSNAMRPLLLNHAEENKLSNNELKLVFSEIRNETGLWIEVTEHDYLFSFDRKILRENGTLEKFDRFFQLPPIFTKLSAELAQSKGRVPLLNINGNLVHGFFHTINPDRIIAHSYTEPEEAKRKYGDVAAIGGVINLTVSNFSKTDLDRIGVVLSLQDKSMQPYNIRKKVDVQARYPGCDDIEGEEATRCATEKFQAYIAESMQYPEEARRQNIEGEVIVKFIVTDKGKIANPEIVKDIGGGCGEEALYLIQNMNFLSKNWIPARFRGEPVISEVVVPIRFKLGGIATKKPFSARNDAFLRGETEQPVDNLVKEENAAREMVSLLSEFEITPRPIFVVDGEIMEKDDVILQRDEVASIHVLDEEEAAEKYQTVNQKAMEIITKSGGDNSVEGLLIRERNTTMPLDSHPLIILDGEEKGTDPTILQNMDPESIARVNVLKPPFSVEKFGDEGENGVIIITTKAAEDKVKIRVNGDELGTSDKEPLIILDGEILGVGKDKIASIDPDQIASMNVLKPPLSVEKYGENAKHGVIIISSKDAETSGEIIGEDELRLTGQVKAFSDVQIYPNPARGSFNLAFKGEVGPLVVEVFDIAGKSLYKQTYEDFNGVFQEEISSNNFVNVQAIIHIRQGDVIQHERITFTK